MRAKPGNRGASHFQEDASGEAAMSHLLRYDSPYKVRQLRINTTETWNWKRKQVKNSGGRGSQSKSTRNKCSVVTYIFFIVNCTYIYSEIGPIVYDARAKLSRGPLSEINTTAVSKKRKRFMHFLLAQGNRVTYILWYVLHVSKARSCTRTHTHTQARTNSACGFLCACEPRHLVGPAAYFIDKEWLNG